MLARLFPALEAWKLRVMEDSCPTPLAYMDVRYWPTGGQLWIVPMSGPPQYVTTCVFQPLLRDCSEVRIEFRLSKHVERWFTFSLRPLAWVVQSPGPVQYDRRRAYFSFRRLTVSAQPGPFSGMHEGEPPDLWAISTAPDFQSVAEARRMWWALQRKQIDVWLVGRSAMWRELKRLVWWAGRIVRRWRRHKHE